MKKVTSLVLLFLALFWAGSTYGITVQIGSGTSTTTAVPISSCYGYTYSQEIYLGSEIQNAGGGIGPITKLRFYYSSGGTSYSTWANWNVYIGNTAKTAFASTTDWEPLANLTQVFSGTIATPVSGTWLEITFSTPFNYTGGNLIVAVDENSASYSCSAAWRSFTPGGNRGIYYRADGTNPDPASPPTGVLVTAIAQIQFEMAAYVPTTPPNCATIVSPANAGTDVAIGTTLNWASGGGAPTGYKLYFGTDNPPTNLVNGTDLGNVTTYTPAAPLSYSTPYYWKVIAYNANGDATGCSVWSFTTLADPTITSLPYFQGFEGTSFAPVGWTNVKTAGTGTPGIWDRQTSGTYPTCSPHGGTAMARYNCFNLSSLTAGILVTPPINIGSDDFELTFWMYRDNGYSTNADLVNIYSNTANNMTGATLLGTINRSTGLAPVVAANGWYEYKFMVDNSAKAILYLIFQAVSAYGNNMFIDDITLDFPPPCVAPTGLIATSNITTTSIEIGWTETGTATQWNIEYGSAGFTQGSGTIVSVTDNPHVIDGLSPATIYDFYVQADCGSGMLSAWSSKATVMTECPNYSVPINESFDGTLFPPLCWTREKTAGTGIGLWERVTVGTYPVCNPHSGAAMTQFNCFNYSNGTKGILVTPAINVVNDQLAVTFWMYRDNGYATSADLVNVYYNTEPNVTNAALLGTVNRYIGSSPVVAANGWYEYFFKSPSGINGNEGYFIFEGVSAYGNDIYIDDINIDVPPPPGFLAGTITDENTGLPIGGAVVTVNPGGNFAISLANGHYALQLEKGTYSATFEKADYYAETVAGILIESSLTTNVNVSLGPIPAPFCADLVSPFDGEASVLPNVVLTWTPGAGSPPPLGYKIQLFNLTTNEWIEGDEFSGTDLGNSTTYTPAGNFDWASDYVWLITPYNNAGVAEGCFPWYFSTTAGGSIAGLVTDEVTGLPVEGVDVLLEQTFPPIHAGNTYNLTTAADGTWYFEGESGNYTITYSKFTYLAKTVTNVGIYSNQVTNQSVMLTPVIPYQIPFVEKWNTGTTFNTQQWSVVPAMSNWYVDGTFGNTSPSVRFDDDPQTDDYSSTLQSYFINGVGKSKIYAQFDLYLSVYSPLTLETMTFMVFDGLQWNDVAVFNNQSGNIPWTQFTFDISSFAAGKQFFIGFKAEGSDTWNLWNWSIDNIGIVDDLMQVSPPALTQGLGETQTAVQDIIITNPGVNTLAWTATFDVAPLWASMPMNGSVPAGGSVAVPVTFDANLVAAGVYDATVTIHGPSNLVYKTVGLHLDVFELQVNPLVVFDEINSTDVVGHNITLTNAGTLPFDWEASFAAQPWFALSESNGTLTGGANKVLTLTFDGTAVIPGSYTAQILFSGAGGMTEKTVDIALNIYDFILDPEAVYDALTVGGMVDNTVTLTNPYTSPVSWTADVPVLPWLTMNPVAGTIPAGGSVDVTVGFDATGLTVGEYSSEITFDAAGGIVVKQLPVGLNVYDTPFQKIMLPEPKSWGYISSYINLDSKMTLEEAMENILDEMVLMIGETGIFWPSQNINTIGNWNSGFGYKLKMDSEGLLVYVGNEVTNKIINFSKGVHIIPVLSDNPVAVADLFAGKPIEFAFGLDGSIWWPAGNITTLQTLYPGYGYMVKFTAATSLNFTGLKSNEVKPNTPSTYANKTNWNDVARTGDVHIISISGQASSELLPGDVIGVFNQNGLCTGMAEYRQNDRTVALIVYADDPTTQSIDGMSEGQPLHFRAFRDGDAYDLEPVYNTNMPNYDGVFAVNGLSQIKGFKVGSVGINENDQTSISVYPNPSSGIFNIDVKGLDARLNIVVLNSQGQEIMTSNLGSTSQIDLTAHPKGVYFVKIMGEDVIKTVKLIVK